MLSTITAAVHGALFLFAVSQDALAGPVELASTPTVYLENMHIEIGRRTSAPFAYTRFCVLNPADCERGAQQRVSQAAIWDAVVATNRRVNKTMRAVHDGRERWTAGGSKGDCEDFALTKRRELIRQGVPASALRMATALTKRGEGHAVLVVSTSSGDFVLDNRTNRIVAWRDADLKWLKVAAAGNPRVWYTVN